MGNCDSCHKGSFSSWATGKFHSNVTVTGQCATCHLSSAYGLTAKPNNATHSGITGGCETCHQPGSSWAPNGRAAGKPDHSGFNASTNCLGCHNGSTATGKSTNHIPVGSASCFSCHGTTGWTPTKWAHDSAQEIGRAHV